jgi:hypothetical protein
LLIAAFTQPGVAGVVEKGMRGNMHGDAAVLFAPVATLTLPVMTSNVEKGVRRDIYGDAALPLVPVAAFTLPIVAGVVEKGVRRDVYGDAAILFAPVAAFTLPIVAEVIEKGVRGNMDPDTAVSFTPIPAYTLPAAASSPWHGMSRQRHSRCLRGGCLRHGRFLHACVRQEVEEEDHTNNQTKQRRKTSPSSTIHTEPLLAKAENADTTVHVGRGSLVTKRPCPTWCRRMMD